MLFTYRATCTNVLMDINKNCCLVLKYMSSEAVNMFIYDITIRSVDLIK